MCCTFWLSLPYQLKVTSPFSIDCSHVVSPGRYRRCFFCSVVTRGDALCLWAPTAASRATVLPADDTWMNMDEWMNEQEWIIFDWENEITRRKCCPCATLSTTSPKWTTLRPKADLRVEKPATNRLSYGTTFWSVTITLLILFIL
jgi:hypothetical protein